MINLKNNTHNIPVKVVRMLCTRIIFTNDKRETADKLSAFMRRVCICHEFNEYSDSCEIEAEPDDEKLYEMCCELSAHITDDYIKKNIEHFLDKNYACFNSDESKIICCNVLARDCVSELPGRLYVYIKVNKSVNPFAFYRFMCTDISREVLDAAAQEADKILTMNENSDFIELLKCYAGVSPESVDTVEIIAAGRGIRITACNPDTADYNAEFGLDEADILSELVTLNPKRILISGKDDFLRNDISAVITSVFEGRIEYLD